jgi:Lipase (class 3)
MENSDAELKENNTKKKMSVWELSEETMAHAMLIFMLADLRILSATGRIRTKYEFLCIDSDKSPRHSSMDFAGFHEYNETRGVTAAHIMAVLMLEISRDAEEAYNRNGNSPLIDSSDLKHKNFRFGREDVERASGLPALLQCYCDMIGKDIASDKHKVKKSEYPMNFEQKVEIEYSRRSHFSPIVEEDDDESESLFPRPAMLHGKSFKDLKVFNQPIPGLAAPTRGQAVIQSLVALQSLMLNSSVGDTGCYSQGELLKLLERAIETRNKKQIGFMKHFFREGSISRVLVESKAEMVWLSDWHTTYECTYAICINREQKKVLLAFRGAYTLSDWAHAFDSKETATSNPIKEDYPNRPKNIRLHGGFHRYLFRVRKDTNTTKYDEIASKVAHYCNIVGEGVTLTITGHSLGAALTTVFCLYASTEERFTKNGAIEVVVFGAPYIAGYKFADAIRHQENAGKLRMVKFHNSNDGVPSLPPTLLSTSKRGAKYFHCGMDVELPCVRKGVFKVFGQPKPKVFYHGPPKGFIREWLRQANDFYFWNIPIRIWTAKQMHTLVEHRKRMELISKDDESSPLIKYSLAELYEMRDKLM